MATAKTAEKTALPTKAEIVDQLIAACIAAGLSDVRYDDGRRVGFTMPEDALFVGDVRDYHATVAAVMDGRYIDRRQVGWCVQVPALREKSGAFHVIMKATSYEATAAGLKKAAARIAERFAKLRDAVASEQTRKNYEAEIRHQLRDVFTAAQEVSTNGPSGHMVLGDARIFDDGRIRVAFTISGTDPVIIRDQVRKLAKILGAL